MKSNTIKAGSRTYSGGINMMAGYYSAFTHARVYEELEKRCAYRDLDILDVGAGHGAFTQRLLDGGYTHLYAIEGYCEFQVPEATLFKMNLNEDWDLLHDQQFDVVVAIEIIEHIENPFHFLRQIRAHVKDNGYVFISTPNPLNFMDRLRILRTGHLSMMEHPDHRVPVFPDNMNKYCQECGFEIEAQTYDIDMLATHSATLKGKLFKPVMRMIRSLVVKNGESLVGNSNIWVLRPGESQRYTPPEFEG
ncbi:MAG: class I SAM-dependent methyltransferase [Bacteroidetes bacterium]|nr:MAG: class I SAM-dependent methyltransferase [Bacteroidota bacterium]